MALYIELGALLVAALLFVLFLRLLRNPTLVLYHSILGVVSFFILDMLFSAGIPINIISVAVVAVGGVVGLLFVLLLHFLGIAF
jgi:hypothetical protein